MSSDPSIIIRFSSQRAEVDQAIHKFQEDSDKILKDFDEQTNQRFQTLGQEALNLNADLERYSRIERTLEKTTDQAIVDLEVANIASRKIIEINQKEVDKIDARLAEGRSIYTKTAIKYEALKRDIRIQQGLIEQRRIDLENRIKENNTVITEQETRTDTVRKKLASISAGISAAAGFLSLYQALADETEQSIISVGLSLGTALISMAVSYGTLAASTGNFVTLAAAGTAAASAATIINTLKGVSRRAAAQRAINERRYDARKV